MPTCACEMHDPQDDDAAAEARLDAAIERGEVAACDGCGDLFEAEKMVASRYGIFLRCRRCAGEAAEVAADDARDAARDMRRGL
jgi:hypothetical protein